MNPSIVLVTTDQEKNARLKVAGVSFLEVRVDLFRSFDETYCLNVMRERQKLNVPLILTVRNQKKEGALRKMSDEQKLALTKSLMPYASWVDIELSSPLCGKLIAFSKKARKQAIISAHYLDAMPPSMGVVLKKSLSLGADMVKIAAHAKKTEDVARLFEFTHAHRDKPLATMAVGPWGALSRITLPLAGSRWVYTFLDKPALAGQISLHELKEAFKKYYPVKK